MLYMKRSRLKTFNENSLDRFISDEKKMLNIKRSRLKTLLDGWMGGWMDGWVGGWMDGWVDGWMAGKAGLRIAYSNQKLHALPHVIKFTFKTHPQD
jgi:hypothetical protein